MSGAPDDLRPVRTSGEVGVYGSHEPASGEGAAVRPPRRSWLPWLPWIGAGALALGAGWLIMSHGGAYQYLLRLTTDRHFLKQTLKQAGFLGPGIFIGVQALQVVFAPVPGELTGFLGGFVFGEGLGFLYSTVGLTLGSLLAFGVGRWLGASVVRRIVPPAVWARTGFLVRPQGAILCFLVFLIPGFPKDIACYLFGLSPLPFGVFAFLMTLGRMPGTWALSAQGARTASGDYLQVALILGAAVAVGLPLYCCRDRILAWYQAVRLRP